jgi:5-oxoprolinase (ATP-hydrolysing)
MSLPDIPVGWQVWIDRGGTFTDIVARAPDGMLHAAKLLSDDPDHYDDAAVEGVRRIAGAAAIANVKMGTTVATNALLERNGAPTVLVVNEGYGDILRIGTQNRPDLFKLAIELPEPLYTRVIEVAGRLDARGTEIAALDEAAAKDALALAYADGFRACAVVLMHSYRAPQHERRIAAIARAAGFTQVSASHEVSPLMKLVPRGDTSVVDAYLSPILGRYVRRVSEGIGDKTPLMFMQSNGGLTEASLFRGKDAILSGPAGGVVGAVETAKRAGFDRIIGFDMGGTSTDVSHYAGAYERAFDTHIAGVRVAAPILRIHTIAAGGGSILSFDGQRFRVGPASAGADPGPASYGKGGPLTVTDANVMLGRIQPEYFPKLFGPNADAPLDAAVVCAKFSDLARDIGRDPYAVAEGFLTVAVENMAAAIKHVSVQRGYEVSTYTLVCFGGAGGQHACRIADALGMRSIFIHRLAGVLSAYGMGLAPIRAHREAAVGQTLSEELIAALDGVAAPLEAACRAELKDQGIAADGIDIVRVVQVRYVGTDTTLEVPMAGMDDIARAFRAAHQTRFGFVDATRGLEIEAILVDASDRARVQETSAAVRSGETVAPRPERIVQAWFGGAKLDAALYARETLKPAMSFSGPAIVAEANATTVIEPGWRARIDAAGDMILTRHAEGENRIVGTDADPVMLEVFNNLFMSIAEQMGAVLANTASSVNIKERLDFSCALFDGQGGLIANAPHLPVHLGSMGESVRAVLRARGHLGHSAIRPGQVFALNAPYNGGTHLPDITVITPIFDDRGVDILFFVGSRGHHADVGGITPGSMPPFSTTVEEEGVLINDFLLVDRGEMREDALRALLAGGVYPARNPDRNIADFRAQIAANARGAAELKKLVARYGLDVVRAYMDHVKANAAEAVCRVLDRLPSQMINGGSFVNEMDFGGRIQVAIRVDRESRSAIVDFTGTSPQTETNFNAPLAVTRAAVLYVFRCLVGDDIPLNDGCLEPLQLIVPEGSMLNPRYPAAVVAGNVETSQAVTAALLAAAGAAAASQGTMNNFTFGNAAYQYYETICGGAGAGSGFAGASAVHTHMTNTRLTDPEVLEWRFPVRLESFGVRRGSGGDGVWRGGDGTVRRIKFLEPMTAAILAQSRRVAPFGLAGGSPGQTGRTWVARADGRIDELGPADETQVEIGDVVVIETPGGGGYGEA